ncbi:MAG: cold shock domain-containing protein [Solirubrobacterales bacterium]|nr:cold shock domain-containing protein [Solirubrobacterales bacterium]
MNRAVFNEGSSSGSLVGSYAQIIHNDLDIRRPELLGVRRCATVRWFKDDKGYGRITADDGEVLFVHFAHIVADAYRTLRAGHRVSFVWNGAIQDHGRHRAEDVRVQT